MAIVGLPPVNTVKALRAIISHEYPKDNLGESSAAQVRPSLRYQTAPDTESPCFGIDVERKDLSRILEIGVSGRPHGGKSTDDAVLGRHHGRWQAWVRGTEGVVGHSIL